MNDFKYKCKKCGTQNSIPADWFRDNAEKKIHSCQNCGNKVQLNAAKIRADLYNNFKAATELVFGNKVTLDDLYLKININDEQKTLMKAEANSIIIGRGNELLSQTAKDENGNTIQKITIPDRFISSKHCELKVNPKNNKVSIQDLGSLNKTFIDDNELSPDEALYISSKNRITIGQTYIEIC